MMENYNSFAETEALLLTAIELPGSSIKEIAAATGILPNTIYKWKSSGKTHLSPKKADKLLLYFIQNEPDRLEMADLLNTDTIINNNIMTASVPSSWNGGSDTED